MHAVKVYGLRAHNAATKKKTTTNSDSKQDDDYYTLIHTKRELTNKLSRAEEKKKAKPTILTYILIQLYTQSEQSSASLAILARIHRSEHQQQQFS